MKRYENLTIGGIIAVLMIFLVVFNNTRDLSYSLRIPLTIAVGWMIFYIFLWAVDGTVREALMEEKQ